jgi:hypothetical protein
MYPIQDILKINIDMYFVVLSSNHIAKEWYNIMSKLISSYYPETNISMFFFHF